jgi:hypothetical protein
MKPSHHISPQSGTCRAPNPPFVPSFVFRVLNSLMEVVQIILSVAEHHANLVPWQMLAKRTGAVLRHAGLNNMQEIDEQVRGIVSANTAVLIMSATCLSKQTICSLTADQEYYRSIGLRMIGLLLGSAGSIVHDQLQNKAGVSGPRLQYSWLHPAN